MYVSLFASIIFCDKPARFTVTKHDTEITVSLEHDMQTIHLRMKQEDIMKLYSAIGDHIQIVANEAIAASILAEEAKRPISDMGQ